jgi:ABC-type glycerol-3-phosphate transport system substrate-binding protein
VRRPAVLIGIGLIIIVLVGLGAFFAYRSFFGGSGTITVWTLSGNEKALADVAKIAQKKNPSYKIQIKGLSEQIFEYQTLFALGAKKGPDVWIMPDDWMALHKSALIAAPDGVLNDAMLGYTKQRPKGATPTPTIAKGRTNAEIISQDYAPIAKNDLVEGDNVYGVPLNMDTLAMYYDRTKISTPPKTWAELADVAKRFTTKSGNTVTRSVVAMGDNTSVNYDLDILQILMLQNGTQMTDAKTNIASWNLTKSGTTPPGTLATDFYTSFARPDKETYTWNSTLGRSLDALKQGKTMIAFGYYGDSALVDSRIAVAPLPQVDTTKPQTYGRYLVASVTKQATTDKVEEAAWKFIALFANPDVAEDYATTTQTIPARIDVAKRITPAASTQVFLDQVDEATNWQKKEVAEADNAFDEALDLILLKGQSPQVALDVASKAYTTFLQTPSGFSADPEVLTLWQDSSDPTDYNQAIASYLESSKTIKRIVISKHDTDRYEWEVLNGMASRQGPNILLLPNDSVARFAPALRAFLSGSFNFFKDGKVNDVSALKKSFIPAVATDNVVDSKIYGMPANVETLMIAYNTRLMNAILHGYENNADRTIQKKGTTMSTLLDNKPIFWDDVKKLTAVTTQRTGNNLDMPFLAIGTGANVTHSQDVFAALTMQYGGQLSDPDRRVTGIHLPKSSTDTTVPGKQALDLLQGFTQPTNDYYTWNKNEPNSLDALRDGKVIAAFVYPSDVVRIQKENPTLSLAFFPFPQLNDSDTPTDYASYYSLTLPATAASPNEAFAFITATVNGTNGSNGNFRSPRLNSESAKTRDRGGSGTQNIQKNTAQSYYKGRFPDDVDQAVRDLLDNKLSLDQAAQKINNLLQQSADSL